MSDVKKPSRLVAFISMVFLIIAAPIEGFALSLLWDWFAVPIFNLPAVSTIQMIGLAFLIRTMATEPKLLKYSTDEELLEAALYRLFAPFGILLLGAIIHALI